MAALGGCLLFPASSQDGMVKSAFLLIFQRAGFWSQMEQEKQRRVRYFQSCYPNLLKLQETSFGLGTVSVLLGGQSIP